MFGLSKPKLPVTADQQRWIDDSFVRLAGLLGNPLLRAPVVLPTPEHFPDPYDKSEASLQSMFQRVAERLQLDSQTIDVELYRSARDLTNGLVPFYSSSSDSAAGLYYHDPSARPHIAIDEKLMKRPEALVAVLAHELGHVILLRPGLMKRDEQDMEPLNDLFTVFAGFGVFTANADFQFEQHNDYRRQGWSARRLGYLSEEQFGYALARYAYESDELKPKWTAFLSTNVASYLKQSLRWLSVNKAPRLL